MYPPGVLFSEGIQSLRSIYKSLRDWFNRNGANLTQHSSRRIVMTLASSVYTDDEETSVAIELARTIIKRRTGTDRSSNEQVSHLVRESGSSNQAGPSDVTTRTACYIAIRFRSYKFSGTLVSFGMNMLPNIYQ